MIGPCATCVFYRERSHATEANWGDCRRYPPSGGDAGSKSTGRFAVTAPALGCGEHQTRSWHMVVGAAKENPDG